MCGIVGLHLKDSGLEDELGALLAPMLGCMGSRGLDSSGIALYGEPVAAGQFRYSLRAEESPGWLELGERLAAAIDAPTDVTPAGTAATLVTIDDAARVRTALAELDPAVAVIGHGRALTVFKDVGAPDALNERYGVPGRRGYQGLGHTRMATESAVTTDHSHPFAADADLCLVHNGSLSNYATIRRELADEGVAFDTDNDSEVAARFIAQRMRGGADLRDALRMVLKELDGFFTFLVATADSLAIVRDSFACKPAVIAETDRYVAVGSEYQALVSLPGISDAHVFEPMPEEIHLWSR